MLLSERRGQDTSGQEWIHELKFDGHRTLAQWDGGKVELRSRNGALSTAWWPEIARSLAGKGKGRCVVDGEMCVLDDLGRSDFDRLQARARMRGYRAGADPVVFCVFDLLVVDGRNWMNVPLVERKAQLEAMLTPLPPSVLYVSHVRGGEAGDWLYEQALALELEGIVAKRSDSPYVPGSRSRDWVKRKRPGAVPPQRFARGPRTT